MSKLEIIETDEQLNIIIPAKVNIITVVYCAFVCLFFIFLLVLVPVSLSDIKSMIGFIFAAIFIIGILYSFFVSLFTLLWNLVGIEDITLLNGSLKIALTIRGHGLKKEYSLSRIKDLRVFKKTLLDFFWCIRGGTELVQWGFGREIIKFNYDTKTILFAHSISKQEAEFIINKIKSYAINPKPVGGSSSIKTP